jgi:hypothetical protein
MWFIKQNNSFPKLKEGLKGMEKFSFSNLKYLGFFESMDSEPKDDNKEGNIHPTLFGDIWYPFKSIPDVRNFTVEIQRFDPLYAIFGLQKRMKPIIEWEKHCNKRLNRYAFHQLERLSLLVPG